MTTIEIDLLTTVAAGTGCGLVVLDEDGLVEYWSPQMEEISGLNRAQIVGQPWSELLLPCDVTKSDGPENNAYGPIDTATVLSGISFYPVPFDQDKPGRRVGVLRLTSRFTTESEDFPLATENGFGIPTQQALFKLLQHNLAYLKRYQTSFSLLFLRVKNFSTFIEVLGNDNWAITNRAVYDQLCAIVRMVDSVGLYDGATFWMVLANSDLDGTQVVADKINRLASSMMVDSIGVFLSVAVGAVEAHEDEKSEDMVRRALLEVEKALKLPAGISVAG